jgi:tetratricopeptide (TPR) repeat protein
MGFVLQDKGQFRDAMTLYQKALQINPNLAEAHGHMSYILLLFGNFKEGWKEFEWRWKTKKLQQRNFSQPFWDGSDIQDKSILLHTEQGFGDAIQFVRYVSAVAQRGAKVILECREELLTLFKSLEGVTQVIKYGEQIPEFDVHCPVMSLPLIFSTEVETIPKKVPYIFTEQDLIDSWSKKVTSSSSKLAIGLVWSGNPVYSGDRYRSLSLDMFSPLNQLEQVTFYSLQKGEAAQQAKNPPKGLHLIDYTDEIHDFSDTAALIENLDLVISVDTAVAHLAGALGKPVWTLLPFVPDWRWMLDREDSPWYPSMRLFRQKTYGDWESLIANITIELKKTIAEIDI